MSYNPNTHIISAPVSIRDIQQCFGTSKNDLGDIITNAKINKWAKWKPIPYSTVAILPDNVRASHNYGLADIPTWSNINKMNNFWYEIDKTSTNYPDCGAKPIYWGYRKPEGASAEPFRLTDFSNADKTYGYFHQAEAPIGKSTKSEYTIDSSGNLKISYNYGAEDINTIKLSELTYPRNLSYSVNNMHFGVMLRNAATGTIYAITRSDTISQREFSVDITGLQPSFNGVYEIYPFLSSVVIPFTSSLAQYTNYDFIALQEPESVGIGATVVKMDIIPNSLSAYRDTIQSSRLLYVGVSLQNTNYQGNLSANVKFDVYNSSDTLLATNTITSGSVNIGASISVDGSVDLGSLTNLRNAYSVRATVTPLSVTNYAITTDVCFVINGPSPF